MDYRLNRLINFVSIVHQAVIRLFIFIFLCALSLKGQGAITVGLYKEITPSKQTLAKVMIQPTSNSIYSLDFKLTYDPLRDAIIAVESGVSESGALLIINTNHSGIIEANFAGAGDLNSASAVLLITMQETITSLQITQALANETAAVVDPDWPNPLRVIVPGTIHAGSNVDKAIAGLKLGGTNASNTEVSMTLWVTNGIITMAENITGGLLANQITNNGTARVTLRGTISAINFTMQQTSFLIYRGNLDQDKLWVEARDDNGFLSVGMTRIDVYTTVLEAWRHDYFLPFDLADPSKESTKWGDLADANGDGRSNLYKYATGLNPISSWGQPIQVTISSSGGVFKVKQRKNDPLLQCQLETSSDKATWSSSTVQIQERNSLDLEFERVSYFDSGLPTPGNPRYYRLKVRR